MGNPLEMPDEDFLNAPIGSLNEEQVEVEEEEEASPEASDESIEDEDEVEGQSEEETPEDDADDLEEQGELDSEEDSSDTTAEALDTSGSDADRVFQPFKANGKDIQVKSADEAIQLMQMGANYTQKMQALQPHLKMVKMLEQQDLLSEEKLNFLIDVSKNDPKAIAKLVQDSKLDPMSLGAEEGEEEYVPQNYSVPDEAMQLEQVLSELESTPTYSKCIDVVGNQWDSSSKQVLTQNPVMIRQLNEQMQTGIFDQINSEVERLKMFGGLSGLSDFDAYKQVGTQMYSSGQIAQANPKPVAVTQVESKAQDDARSLKRRAASTPKSSKKAVVKDKKFNPLAMSDEDFGKIAAQQYN